MVERLHEIYVMWAIMMKKDGIWSDIAKDATLNDWIVSVFPATRHYADELQLTLCPDL
jgi:hypothetical protein